VRLIRPLAILLILLAGCILLNGCETADFMDAKDKQPRVTLIHYATSPASLGGGSPSFYQEYGFRKETWTDPVTQEEMEQYIPLYPVTVSRFDVIVGSYHINQGFEATIMWPSAPFPDYRITAEGALDNAARIPTSDHGRGPGGYLTTTVAWWAPKEGCPFSPVGYYTFGVIITDQNGHSAMTSIGFSIRAVIVEEVNLDEE
jgi:hypothetical protein